MKESLLISLRSIIKKHKELYENCSWTEEEKEKLEELKAKKKTRVLVEA